MAIPAVVGAAAVTGIASLFGAKKGSNAAKDAAQIQNDFAQKALDEQRRVYDLEQADEARQREARAGIFDRYGVDPSTSSTLPNPYGMSDTQAATFRQGNLGTPGKGLSIGPPMPGARTQPMPRPAGPQTPWAAPGAGKPTVTLQAPTGEMMDVDIDHAPELIKRGAVIVPKQGAQNAFGGSYGVV